MSRSNYDKPFYVDCGTSIAAVRCASNHDVVARFDHGVHGDWAIEEAGRVCDRLNAEAAKWREDAVNAVRSKLYRVASRLRSISAQSDSRERGVHYSVIQETAQQLETIADEEAAK